MIPEFIITSLLRMSCMYLIPQGAEFLENRKDAALTNLKIFINENIPTRWLREPIEEIVDTLFPLVANMLIDFIRDQACTLGPLAMTNLATDELCSHVVELVQNSKPSDEFVA